MLLNSDAVPEIDQIKPIVPEISQYADDIREMRLIQKGIFSQQFRKDTPEMDQPLFTLPKLPTRKLQQKERMY